MKKQLLAIMAIGMGLALLGGPPPGPRPRPDRGRRDYRPAPPPPDHHHHHHGGNDGVRLAADIVGLVGASVNLLAPRTTVVVPAQPVAPAPVVVQQPVVEPVVVQQPVVQPVVQQPVVQQPAVQPQPVNNTTIIIQQPKEEAPKTGRENGYNPHGYNL